MATAAAPPPRLTVRAARERTTPDDIVEWRFDELERAGYDAVAALRLALAPDVDLSRARDLVRRGCAPALALLILL